MLFHPRKTEPGNYGFIDTFLVAIGLQAVGNSKTAPAGPFDYMDLMFEKQDEIHSFADTGKSEKNIIFIQILYSK